LRHYTLLTGKYLPTFRKTIIERFDYIEDI